MALFVRKDFLELTSKNCDHIGVDDTGYYKDQTCLPVAEAMNNTEAKLHLNECIAAVAADKKCSDTDPNRVNLSENDVIESMIVDLTTTHIDTEDYRLIRSCIYPKNVDDRSHEQKIVDEACFHLGRYMNFNGDHYDPDTNTIKVPVQKIFELVYKFTVDIGEFR